MTHRDLLWRGSGLAVLAVACTVGMAHRTASGDSLGLFCFATALFGAVLVIQGKRVPAALRVERGRHPTLPQAIHSRRNWRSNDADG